MLMKEIKVQYLHQVCAAEEDPVSAGWEAQRVKLLWSLINMVILIRIKI